MATAIAQGALIGLAFLIVGLPDPLVWGSMAAFASILPVLGTGLVWMPAVIVLAFQQRYGAMVVMLIIGWLLASNIDNVIRPMVYRKVSNIHPMVTLVGAFAGIKYFGLPGLLLGPLAIAYFFELMRFYQLEYGKSAPLEAAVAAAPLTTRPGIGYPQSRRSSRSTPSASSGSENNDPWPYSQRNRSSSAIWSSCSMPAATVRSCLRRPNATIARVAAWSSGRLMSCRM